MKKIYTLIYALLFLGIGTSDAQYTVLQNFNTPNGLIPLGNLTVSGNLFYGMTNRGGMDTDGNIFSIDTNGNNCMDRFDFNGPNGEFPNSGSLKLSGNKFYGMTNSGGKDSAGCIFSVDTNGFGFKILLSFNDTNGAYPDGSLTILGNKLYGTTHAGGLHDSGCIFSIDTSGNGYKDMYDFATAKGAIPIGDLTVSGSMLYGMADVGGANNVGCIFSIDTSGGNYRDLFDFNTRNGKWPSYGSLKISGNKLFGMAYAGGMYDNGCVFSIDTSGDNYKDLLDFNGTKGAFPWGSLTLSENLLYGITCQGGVNTVGCIFSLDTGGIVYNDLFNSIIQRARILIMI